MSDHWPTPYLRCMHTRDDTSEMVDPAGMMLCFKAVLETVLKLDQIE